MYFKLHGLFYIKTKKVQGDTKLHNPSMNNENLLILVYYVIMQPNSYNK